MTVEEFERSLQDFGEGLSNIQPILLNIGGRIVDEIKAGAPVDSGALRNSIKAVIEDDSLTIAMLYYGIFQNYGVDGTANAPARVVPSSSVGYCGLPNSISRSTTRCSSVMTSATC